MSGSLHELKILETLGVEIGLDFDDELLVTFPEKLDLAKLRSLLSEEVNRKDLRQTLIWNRSRSMRQFVGGPRHGQQYLQWELEGTFRGFRISRAKWAVYEYAKDGRAFFRGWATSQRKARRGEFVREES